MAKTARYVMQIDANGSPAVSELGRVESAVADVDEGVAGIGETAGGLEGQFGGISDELGNIAGGVGIGAVAAGLKNVLDQAAQVADEAIVLSEFMGISAEDAQKLNIAFGEIGLEADEVLALMDTVVQRLEESPELADELGVALGPDGVLDPMEAISAAIRGWEDDILTPTQKIELFGEEGVRQIGLMIASGKSLEEILDGINPAEIYTEEELARAREYQELMADIERIWQAIVLNLGGEAFRRISEYVKQVEQLRDFVLEVAGAFGLVESEASDAGVKVVDIRDTVREIPSEIPISVPVTTRWVNGLPPGYSYPARPSTTVNQTIVLGRAATAADVAAATARWTHANGAG